MTAPGLQTAGAPASELPRRFNALQWLLLLAGFGVLAAGCLHEIGASWVWGHNGYNGAAFCQAARNTLRFGELGQAQYWTGPEAPPAGVIYTHHPLLLHLHVAGFFVVFGEHEWAGRLVPVIYTLLSGLMIVVIARRHWGPWVAVSALAVFALQPIVLIYGNMIDHEQGGIFWSLVMLWAYLRWFDSRRWRDFALFLFGTSMGGQFDWPPYYLAFFLAVHLTLAGVRASGSRPRRSRLERIGWMSEYSYVALYSFVVLVNFFGYFAWIYSLTGSFADMTHSFSLRAGPMTSMWSGIAAKAPLMMHPGSMALAMLWLGLWVLRAGRGGMRLRDLVPWCFFVMQVLHHAVFKNAASLHIYWFYYAAPFVAFGAGIMLVDMGSVLRRAAQGAWDGVARFVRHLRHRPEAAQPRALARWLRAGLAGAVVAAMAVAFLAPWTRAAYAGVLAARVVGSSPLSYNGETHYDRTQVAAWIHERTSIDEAVWFDDSFHFRVETLWYLDRVKQHASRLPKNPQVAGLDVAFWAADISRREAPDLERLLREGYDATLFNNRFVVVDLRSPGGALDALRFELQPPTWWWRFLVSRTQPPTQWVDDADGLARLQSLAAAARNEKRGAP